MIALITAIAAMILAGVALAIVALATAGARREPEGWLSVQAPGPLTGLARRMLGLHVRRASTDVPEPDAPETQRDKPASAAQTSGADR